jgi:hypothetical protein
LFEPEKKIGIYTSAYEKGVLYIANPWFKDSQWQDWAYVEWGEDYGVCPVHLLAFIDLRALTKDIDIQGTIIENVFFVATVHMIEKPLDTKSSTQKYHGSDFAAHANSWLFYKSSNMRSKDNETAVSLLHVKSILGCALDFHICLLRITKRMIISSEDNGMIGCQHYWIS